MKNFIIIGLTALLLFSVSAGLSVYLQQAKTTAEDDGSKKKKKSDAGGEKENPGKGPTSPPDAAAPKTSRPDPDILGKDARSADAGLKVRERLLIQREARNEVILEDIRREREALQDLVKKVMAEMKQVQSLMADVEAKSAGVETTRQAAAKVASDNAKKAVEQDATERAGLVKLAAIYEGMEPERAAETLQQLADSGKLDTAAKILAQIKDRQSAKILQAIKDNALAAQLVDRIRLLRKTPPPGPG